ncbi:MAG: thiamine/thiamine pyrophosphate ABC transporter, permease protein [Rhizobiales bacterium 63-7]|nr:MAG: thiamine/thiamine pyrophosphate ABC transporter, permease protein [Rhizobiales bacterium 63-7]
MLTARQRLVALSGGGLVLAALFLFVGLAIARLVALGGWAAALAVVTDRYILGVLQFTLFQASLSTALSILFAIPVARALARQRHFAGRIWLVRLLAVPMGLPALIGALGLIAVWGRQGIANQGLSFLGLSEPVSIYGLTGILIAHVFFNMPLACRFLLIGLERIPGEYWLMSASLGLRGRDVFRFIEWPVMRRILPGVAGLIFMLCATSFTLVLTLGGGPKATTLEVAIYQALRFDFEPPRAIGLALMQIAVTAVILAVIALLPAPEDRGLTLGTPVRRLDAGRAGARLADTVAIGVMLVFTALPLIAVLVAGLRSDLMKLVAEPIVHEAALTSLVLSLSAGLIAVVSALAIVHAQQAAAGGGLLLRGFSLALAASSALVLLVPPIVLATGWFLMLLPTGDVGAFAAPLVAAINAAMALPFVVRLVGPAFREHRIRTGRLAASLGLSGWARLRLIDWPGLRKPLLMGLSFAMALSLGDLGAVALFGSDNLMTLPWLVYSRMGNYRTADADGLALLLGLICLALTVAGTLPRAETPEEDRNR